MSRKLTIRQPQLAEVRQLHQALEDAEVSGVRRRAEAVLLQTAGFNAREIAQALEVHPNTIYADLRAFDQHGVAALHQLGHAGLPPSLSPRQQAEICRLAEQPPFELGLPYGRWSLAKLRAYLLEHRVLRAISREHLRRVLKKGACTSAASNPSCSAWIPAVGRF